MTKWQAEERERMRNARPNSIGVRLAEHTLIIHTIHTHIHTERGPLQF